MTESYDGGGTGITGDDNSFLFELLSLLLNHRLSLWVSCGELDDCWPTNNIWVVLMTELSNGGKTDITVDENSLLFELLYFCLKQRLSWWVVNWLPLLFPVPLFCNDKYPLGVAWWMQYEFWWCCVPVILSVDGHQKAIAFFLAQQLQSCLSFSTNNKIGYELFVSISS